VLILPVENNTLLKLFMKSDYYSEKKLFNLNYNVFVVSLAFGEEKHLRILTTVTVFPLKSGIF
jgi:hypothetical protein